MLFSSPLFSCYCLACAQCSKQLLGWGSVPGARCPLDQGQEPARVVAGWDRTAPALALSWLPRKGDLLEPRSREKCCQKATNPKCWDEELINDALKSKNPGFIAVLWEAGQKVTPFRSGKQEGERFKGPEQDRVRRQARCMSRTLSWDSPVDFIHV